MINLLPKYALKLSLNFKNFRLILNIKRFLGDFI